MLAELAGVVLEKEMMPGSQGGERTRRERKHFEGIAEERSHLYWADRMPAARRRQRLRADRLARAIGMPGEGRRVLDAGCGTGDYTRPFAAATGASITGIDLSPALLRRAGAEAPANVRLAVADAGLLPFRAGVFDAIIGNAILHHLPLEVAVPEFLRVLRPGGMLGFAEPNMLNPQVFLERRVRWIGSWLENSPDETAFIRWRIGRTLESFGLRDVCVEPFDFLYPLVPRPLVGPVELAGRLLERIPGIREIAGSLLISARKGAGAGVAWRCRVSECPVAVRPVSSDRCAVSPERW